MASSVFPPVVSETEIFPSRFFIEKNAVDSNFPKRSVRAAQELIFIYGSIRTNAHRIFLRVQHHRSFSEGIARPGRQTLAEAHLVIADHRRFDNADIANTEIG